MDKNRYKFSFFFLTIVMMIWGAIFFINYFNKQVNETYHYITLTAYISTEEEAYFKRLYKLRFQEIPKEDQYVYANEFSSIFYSNHMRIEDKKNFIQPIISTINQEFAIYIPFPDNNYNKSLEYLYYMDLNGNITKYASFKCFGVTFTFKNQNNNSISIEKMDSTNYKVLKKKFIKQRSPKS